MGNGGATRAALQCNNPEVPAPLRVSRPRWRRCASQRIRVVGAPCKRRREPPQGGRNLRVAALGLPFYLALAPLLLLVWRLDFLTDDSFIAFRYAKHLARGDGLVFNPGQAPVEGFSNLLWVLYLSVFERLGADVTLAARVSSIVCGILLLALLSRALARRLDPLPRALALLFFATLPPVAAWCTGGLETMPFALAVLWTFERLLGEPGRPRPLRAALGAVAVLLLRADGFAWVGLILVTGGLTHWLRGRPPELRRAIGRVALAASIAFLALTAFRLLTFGDWLPNTARAKVSLSPMSFERGLNYAASFLLTFPACLLALLSVLLHLRRPRGELPLQCTVMAGGTLLYAVVVGGDFMTMGRFLVPALPFLALLFGCGLERIRGEAASARLLPGALTALCVLGSLMPLTGLSLLPDSLREALNFRWNRPSDPVSEIEKWRLQRDRARLNALLGRALALHTRPGESLIRQGVGAVGYYTELRIHDPHGLTSREVALAAVTAPDRSAGHDRLAPPGFFERYSPTYHGADLVDAADAELLPKRWSEGDLASERFDVRIEELPTGQGFPPGQVLRLVRHRR